MERKHAWSEKLQNGELILICDKSLEHFERWLSKQALQEPGGGGTLCWHQFLVYYLFPCLPGPRKELRGPRWWQSDGIWVLVLNDITKVQDGKERGGKKETRTTSKFERYNMKEGERERKELEGSLSVLVSQRSTENNNCFQVSGDLFVKKKHFHLF